MKWNKKISTILSLFFISSLMLLSFGYSVNTTSNDINSQNNGLAESPWPRYRGNNQGTGLSPYNTDKVNGTEKWNFELDSKVTSSPVIGPEGVINVGSSNKSLYAVTPNGSLRWKRNLEGVLSNPPTISSEGNLYFTLKGDGSEDRRDLISYSFDGEFRWKMTPKDNQHSFVGSPVISSKGTIFVRTNREAIYAVNPNGTVKWKEKLGNSGGGSPLVMFENIIYYGSGDNHLYAYYPNSTLKWKCELGIKTYNMWPFFYSSPMISSEGRIYILAGDSSNYHDWSMIAVDSNGIKRWSRENPETVYSDGVLGSENMVYYGNESGWINSISPDGTVNWKLKLDGKIQKSSLSIGSEGTIYLGTDDERKGKFYAVNPDGSIEWTVTKEGNFTSPAIGSDGTVYVGNEDGKLYALGPSSPEINIIFPKQKEIYKDSLTIEWESSTIGTDIDHYEVKIDEESWTDVGKDSLYEFEDLKEGKHVVKVKAVAESGNYDIDSIEITVNKPPEITITAPIENEIFNTSTVTVVWYSSDGSGIDNHEVQLDDDNWIDVSQNIEYTFEDISDGEHTVRVIAVDNTGNSTEKSVNFTVDTTPPTADAVEDIEVGISEQFTLDGTGSTDNIGIESYKWMINGETYNKKVVDLSIDKIGEYTAELTVIDIAGNNGTDTITVSVVDNVDPTADAGEDRTVKVDEEVIFDASGSSDNVEITSYEWDFDDGTTATGKTVNHKFDEKGTYEVKLTVTDEAGNIDTDTVTVKVEKKDDNGGKGTPGFTIIFLLLSITLIELYRYKKREDI